MTRISRANPVSSQTDADRRSGSGDVFNWKASNTRRLQRSLGNTIAGTGFSDHVIIGDSVSSCYTAQGTGISNFPAMWSRKMRTQINARGIPLGGTGWVFTADDSTYTPPNDPRWSFTNTWTYAGFSTTAVTGATATFTSDLPGTAVQVAYLGYSVPFTVTIDGGAPVTPTYSGLSKVDFYTVTGLANTTHTVTITALSTGYTAIMGAQVYGASGLRIHNMSRSGMSAYVWAPATFPQRSWFANQMMTEPNVDVIHIALGVNDFAIAGRTIAQMITDLTTIRQTWPTADCILYGEGMIINRTLWPDFIQALYRLAVTLDCPLIDLNNRWALYTSANPAGMYGDGTHPAANAHGDWGLLVTNLMLKTM